jgi:hypothetical protein
MKKHYILAGLLLLAAAPGFAQVKIGAAGAPDASATLEVTGGAANNKGLLLPRLTTVQRDAISNPATGLLIYNTTTNEVQANTGTPAAPVWATATAASWNTSGNAGSDPATNFIGTTDNQPLVLRTNNIEKLRVTANGRIGIGTATPATKVQIVDAGDVSLRVGTSVIGNKSSVNLGSGNNLHGITLNLTAYGGEINDLALHTAASSISPGNLHLVANPTSIDTMDLNQFVLKGTGLVGIGTKDPTARLSVNGTTNNLSGTWGIFSDARVKTIDADYTDGLATVMKIHPVKFHYNANAPFKSSEQQIGIIAQEMEAIAPYMVTKTKAEGFNDLRQYNNQALPYMLVNAIQEQQKMIENLKAALAVSKADNAALKADVSKISALAERMQRLEASLSTTANGNTTVSK